VQRIIYHVNVIDSDFVGILVASAKPVLGSLVESIPSAINACYPKALAAAASFGQAPQAELADFRSRIKDDGVTARIEGAAAHSVWAVAAALASIEVGFLQAIDEDPLSASTELNIDDQLPEPEICELWRKIMESLAASSI